MNDLSYLVPLFVGLGVMALGSKLQMPRGLAMNRPAFGASLLVGSLFWGWSGAILLVREGKYYHALNLLTVLVFFVGLAFLFPSPRKASEPNEHGLPGTLLIWTGFFLGLAHCLGMMFSASWTARLLEFYRELGLHGAPALVP